MKRFRILALVTWAFVIQVASALADDSRVRAVDDRGRVVAVGEQGTSGKSVREVRVQRSHSVTAGRQTYYVVRERKTRLPWTPYAPGD
jgi:hypothetical protein